MFESLNNIIGKKQKSGFAARPAQAAFVCEQAKTSLKTLISHDLDELRFQFKNGTLYLFAPHPMLLELSTVLPELQKILEPRVGRGKVRVIKIRAL